MSIRILCTAVLQVGSRLSHIVFVEAEFIQYERIFNLISVDAVRKTGPRLIAVQIILMGVLMLMIWDKEYTEIKWKCGSLSSDPLETCSLFICLLWVQEYNIHGWWVGELNGTVGIVPKDFLQPAYILWAPTGTKALSYHQHYEPLLWPNTQKRSPWYSSRLPLRYIQSLTCHLWHLLAGRSTA